MKPEKNSQTNVHLDSSLLYQQARLARSKYVGELMSSACGATLRAMKGSHVSVAICVLLIVSGIAVIAV